MSERKEVGRGPSPWPPGARGRSRGGGCGGPGPAGRHCRRHVTPRTSRPDPDPPTRAGVVSVAPVEAARSPEPDTLGVDAGSGPGYRGAGDPGNHDRDPPRRRHDPSHEK